MLKTKTTAFRLMGFGHRVYKNFDPRAKVMRETCHEVLKELNIKDPLLDVAMELERIALSDPYFIEKKLYPNVDFYSGIILKAIGIPTSMFTVIFAMCTYCWLDFSLGRNVVRQRPQNWSSASAVYRLHQARLQKSLTS